MSDFIASLFEKLGLAHIVSGFSLIGNLWQFLYHKYEKYFLFSQKIQFWILNKTTYWNVSMQFRLGGDIDVKQKAIQDVFTFLKNREFVEIYKDLPNSKTLLMNGTVYKLSLDLNDDVFSIQSTDQKVPYRDAIKIIENDLLKLIEILEKQVNLTSTNYSLVVKFKDITNPYLGLFLKRTGDKKIKVFNCVIDYADNNIKNSVSINLDSISVFAQSREEFRKLSRQYITLSRV